MFSFIFRVLQYLFPFLIEKIPLASEKNPTLQIERDGIWGIHVVSGGAFQSGDYPEGMWSATFRTVPLGKIKPCSMLVLGSGAGSSFYVAQQILKKENVSCHFTGVEWDPVMTAAGTVLYSDTFDKKITSLRAKDFPPALQTNSHPYRAKNVTVIHTDAMDFLLNSQDQYPMILIDLFLCFEVSQVVFDPRFIEKVYERLAPNGHIIINAFNTADRLVPLWQKEHSLMSKISFQSNTVIWIR